MDEFAEQLHDAGCMHGQDCRMGQSHRDYYRNAAQELMDKLVYCARENMPAPPEALRVSRSFPGRGPSSVAQLAAAPPC